MSGLKKFGKVAGSFVLFLAAAAAVYLVLVQPWDRKWGAIGAEVARVMPGDDLVSNPNHLTTRAVTIKAPPERIWPWLVQMGFRRGGLYSYDWLDRLAGVLDAPSANEISPEFQRLAPGDTIPMGYGPGWPVSSLEPGRSLVLDIHDKGVHVSWCLGLRPLNAGATRLVLRVRSRIETKPLLSPLLGFLDLAEFPMVLKMLTGIKDRVEGRPPEPSRELLELGSWALIILLGLIAAITAFFKAIWRRFFLLACAAFLAVFFLAFAQPVPWVILAIDLVMCLWLYACFRAGHRKTRII